MEAKKSRISFQGKPIIKPFVEYDVADFLKGDYGKQIYEEAKDRAINKYNSANPLMSPVYNEVVRGSNPFYVVLINEVLRSDSSQKLRTATQSDIEKTLRVGDPLEIKGNYYVDTALALRSVKDSWTPNIPLARDFFEQIKSRLGKDVELPVMVNLCDLELKIDNNEYGLGFIIREGAQIVYAPILNESGNFDFTNPETGLPDSMGGGNRQWYTKREGLSGLYLGRDLYLSSFWNDLGCSGVAGRVVVFGGEAAQKNFSEDLLKEQTKKLRDKRDEIVISVNKRYEEALKHLQGKE